MVRSLLANGRFLTTFWPEAVNWSVHILNQSPEYADHYMTPEEAWSGRKPEVDHFRVFGWIAYAHVPNVLRKKLDDKGEKCVFLGVSETSKAYKLYNPITRNIKVSQDVEFDEESTWSWNNKPAIPLTLNEGEDEQVS